MQKKRKNIFFWFMGLMGKRLPIYLLAVLVSTIGLSGRGIISSYILKIIVTTAQTRQMDGLILRVILTFLAMVASMLFWRVGIIRYNIEAKMGVAKVEKIVFSKALRLPMSYYENHHSGDFLSKLIFDTGRAGEIYGSRFRRLSSAIISSIIYLIPMFYYSWQLTSCLLALSLVSLVVNSRFTKPMKAIGKKYSNANGTMTQKLMNILGGMELTKIFPIGARLQKDFMDANDECWKIQKKTNRLAAVLDGFGTCFNLTGALAFLGLGIIFVSKGLVGLGALTAIYAIYGDFQYSFLEIGKYLPEMMNCIANAEKVYQFLELEEEPEHYQYIEIMNDTDVVKQETNNQEPDNQEPDNQEPDKQETDNQDITGSNLSMISMSHVSFSYRSDRKILNDFSMSIPKGSFVAITGASGRGKSTLAKLLLGFYAPDTGDIRIQGQSYQNMTLEQVRQKIAYVPQEPYLYGVSIADNIAYGCSEKDPKEVPQEDIIKAAKAANAHDFIMKLPNGYQTIPGERGNTLSGGEKQRIAIARAVLKNAPVLLLDEATSALDNESERLVNEALDRLCTNRTTIMIAHRTSTIALADYVISLT